MLTIRLCAEADQAATAGRMLVGTWKAADWAIGFYEHHGFTRCAPAGIAPLLRRYWRIPDRRIATWTVLISDAPAQEAGEPP